MNMNLASKNSLLLALVMLLAFTALPLSVIAQEIVIEPPPPPIAWLEGISVDEHLVRATIEGPIAEVVVSQVFRNESNRLAEGSFLFPLPEDAAVGDFQMTVNGQVIEGQLMDSDHARRIYEETVRQIRDPALLEYAGRGLYQTSVFPIPPGETRTLQLRYGVLLEAEDGLHRFTYPLRIPGISHPPQRTDIVVEITNDDGLRAVYSSSHDVDLERTGDTHAIVRYVTEGEPLDTDFELYYGLGNESIGLNLISYRPAGEDGYFVLLASPSIEVSADDIVDKDIVFVLDVSGSMEGPKLAQAKDAVRYVVEHLNPGDRFNLVAFSTGVRLWDEELVAATQDNVADAVEWIDGLRASGSTDINRSLLEALAQLDQGKGRVAPTSYVLFMTDGLPTQGETEAPKIVRNVLANQPDEANVRLFTFGVGYDVNTDLLDNVSRQLGGRSRYVRPDQQIDEAVSTFYTTIQTPVLTDVDVEFGSDTIESDMFPYPLPDLFAGEQLVVTGRYRNGGETTIILTGQVDDERVSYVYADRKLVNAGGEPFVARLWATRKIGSLMNQIRISGPEPELVDAIVDLSMRYGIVTPYTSYLVEEPDMVSMAQGNRVLGGSEPPEAPAEELRSTARASVAAEAEQVAAAPASGEAAVMASETREKLQTADTVEEHRDVRFAGGKTFVSQGEVIVADGGQEILWVDTEYSPKMSVETVAFASEQYFDLASDVDFAEMLALSPEILIALDDTTAVRITSVVEEADAHLPPASDPGANDVESDESLWGQFWNWLTGNSGR